ncbi:hypothetical protein GF352_02515 [archaeon]|nr:hypothetical protein [archaeon]
MKRLYSALTALIILSCASALTININSEQTEASSYENLTINYVISLNQEEATNYTIKLYNQDHEFLILNHSESVMELNQTINYNLSSVASGEYALSLRVTNPSLSTIEHSPTNVTVLQDYDLEITAPEKAYLKGDEGEITALVNNKGNTDLGISAYFKNALSEITITPQSFRLERGSNKTLSIRIKKPEEDYNTTLVIISTINDEETRNEQLVEIIIPVINLTLGEVNTRSTGNETMIEALVNNTGNKDVNATVNIRTFSIMEGFKTITKNELFNIGGTNYTTTIPKASVIGLTITYNGFEESRDLSFLNKVPFDFKLSPERLLLLAALAGLLIIILYFKFRRKRRP